MKEKHNFEEKDITTNRKEEDPKTPTKEEYETPESLAQKEIDERNLRHKLWLKACENILFVCPCCQGYCLYEKLTESKKEFSMFSVCNFNYKLEHHPRHFLRKDIYWYKVQGIYKMF